LGQKIQTIQPRFLFEEFNKKVNECAKIALIVNDDCRPHNFKYLQEIGFEFIRILGSPRNRKDDKSEVNCNHLVEWTEKQLVALSDCNIIINDGNFEKLYKQLDSLMERK